jgi:hypothetical protein
MSIVVTSFPSRYTRALPRVGPTGPAQAMAEPLNLIVAVAPREAVECTRPPRYDECRAYDHEPDQRIELEESERALVRYVAEVTHSPTVLARSIARTRKRTVAPFGTLRRA